MEEPTKTCIKCRFYVPLPKWDGVGTCHEDSPKAYITKQDPSGLDDGGAVWPKVVGDDPNFWCGKWTSAGVDLGDVESKREEGIEV